MNTFRRTCALFLVPVFIVYTLVCLTVPKLAYAGDEKITQFSPETIEAEPLVPPKPVSKGLSWWWYAIGAVAIAAAASGGGGGGGSSSGGGGGSSSGSASVGW